MKKEPYTTILCYGDSNTYGYDPRNGLRYAADVRWPGRLQVLLGGRYRILEEGCNGRTASVTPWDEPWKDGRTCLKAILNSHKPIDWFVLFLGSNDLKKQFAARDTAPAAFATPAAPAIPATPTTPATITDGIREILVTAAEFLMEKQGFVPRALLIAPPEIGEGIEESPFAHSFDREAIERSRQLPALYEKTAAELTADGLIECDYLNAQAILRPSELDSLHLMPEAHTALAEAVAELFRQRGAGPSR
jgi:lysophospholipase L1-like esterase